MLEIRVPIKRVDPARLKSELVAAGIPDWPDPLLYPGYAGEGLMSILLPLNSDPDDVRRVVEAHTDKRTPAEIIATSAKDLTRARDAQAVRDRARDRLVISAVQAIMRWNNALRAELIARGIPLKIPALPLRTEAELIADLSALIDQDEAP